MAPPLHRRPNHALIGVPGSRERLATPALVLDLDAFEANVTAMADWARRHGLGLRPHAKTHKCSIVARKQIEAGALGNCAATLAEAETLVDAGIPGVLATSPAVGDDRIRRLIDLNDRADGLMAVADDPSNVDALDAAAAGGENPLSVLVDVDVGGGRTGAATPQAALDLIDRISASPNLRFRGLQAYDGGTQAIADFGERRRAAAANMAPLRRVLAETRRRGTIVPLVSGGGTGTHDVDRIGGLLTEIQAGSYIVMDAIYDACDLRGDGAATFRAALFVAATVVSTAGTGYAIADAGIKAFGAGAGDPVVAGGAPPGATYALMGDEHGRIAFAGEGDAMALGDRVECVTPHCDPAIALHDCYHAVRGDTLVDIWPIDARGHW